VLILAAAMVLGLAGQAFEVASIRPHTAPLHTIMGRKISGPRVTLEGYTVPQLIIEAYGLKGIWQLSLAAVSGQSDLLNVYYDIAARAPGETAITKDESRKMLQTLLADRFQLSIHRETKELPVYALLIGKNGPKLKASATDADCAVHVSAVTGGQSYSLSNCTIDVLVDLLGNGLVDRPVIDKTQLTEKYDFRLAAMPDFMSRNRSDPAELSPFTALQDLGLRLQAQTAPVEIIAVDRVEKPSAN
jgi:uncharacterized protein (TIGR03435 family)